MYFFFPKITFFFFQQCNSVNCGNNSTKRPFLVNCGLLSAMKQPKMVQLIRSKIQNEYLKIEKHFKHPLLWLKQCKSVNFGKNNTKRPFLVSFGSLSAIKQPKMVQLIRSKNQNENLYLGNIFQYLEFWLHHFKGVNFGKNGTERPFLENCGLLSAIKQPKMVQIIR